MLRRILTRLQARSDFLKELLLKKEGREILIGETKIVSLEPNSIRRDANRIVKFADTEDYEAFAKEVVLDILDSIDQLCKPELTISETDFYRGSLAQSINLLKVSYKAHYKIKELNETQKG